jgi:hypothetical protein
MARDCGCDCRNFSSRGILYVLLRARNSAPDHAGVDFKPAAAADPEFLETLPHS